ncbi:MAG TPA: hypothetical protein VJI46_07185 [Candidatus Nanoarchaeia archaeon]|nr:hypothetical protein [Candidatus Nanoarchaeia archaeon]
MGEQKNVIITYETLYELLRLEKIRPELQKLDRNFLEDCAGYVSEKKEFVERSAKSPSLFSAAEEKSTELQLVNVKKIMRELYERREKKIIQMAVDKSRSPSAVIDTSAMLQEELEFFESLSKMLSAFRESLMDASFNPQEKKAPSETTMVRFVHPVPKFVGKELEVYGPFQEDDMANLPTEIAILLLNKGHAEEIKGT